MASEALFASAVSGKSDVVTTQVTFDITIDNVVDRLLLVDVSWRSFPTTPTVTFTPSGGSPLTVELIEIETPPSLPPCAAMYRLINPPVGLGTVTITWASPATRIAYGAKLVYQAHQTTPVRAFASATALDGVGSISQSVTSAVGDLIVSVLARRNSTNAPSENAGQTQRWAQLATGGSPSSVRVYGRGSTKPGEASSTSMGWTWTPGTDDQAVMIIAAIQPSDTPIDPPGAPSISATKISDTRIDVAMTAGTGATGHILHASGTPGFTPGAGTVLHQYEGPTVPAVYQHTGLAPGTFREYVLVSSNSGGDTLSNRSSATTDPAPSNVGIRIRFYDDAGLPVVGPINISFAIWKVSAPATVPAINAAPDVEGSDVIDVNGYFTKAVAGAAVGDWVRAWAHDGDGTVGEHYHGGGPVQCIDLSV